MNTLNIQGSILFTINGCRMYISDFISLFKDYIFNLSLHLRSSRWLKRDTFCSCLSNLNKKSAWFIYCFYIFWQQFYSVPRLNKSVYRCSHFDPCTRLLDIPFKRKLWFRLMINLSLAITFDTDGYTRFRRSYVSGAMWRDICG